MRLCELIETEPLRLAQGDGSILVTGVSDDSRLVDRGFVFVARGGTQTHGEGHIADAIARGAVALVCERVLKGMGDDSLTWVVGDHVDQGLVSRLAERFYGFPSKQLRMIGVTGTNGKTTVSFFIQHLLKCAGWRCGLMGTVCIDDGETRVGSGLTTVGPVDFSKRLRVMADHGCQGVVAEVSSHALDQGRVAGVGFDAGVFTNLTGDHLDYHGSMSKYASAKAKLFEGLSWQGWAVVNGEDSYSDRMLEGCRANVVKCMIGCDGSDGGRHRGGCGATVLSQDTDGSVVKFDGVWGSVVSRVPFVGRHNVMNMLQAVATLSCLVDISPDSLGDWLVSCPSVPGRLERVEVWGCDSVPTVLVDYAHTHDALANALVAVRGSLSTGRVVVVFGCGGDRDVSKRPKMADVACRLADRIVITTDNPRGEDPEKIINEVLAGVPVGSRGRVTVESDRSKAIMDAVCQAKAEDVVLVAGKGHEDYQIVGDEKHPFDDREQVREALRFRAEGS